MYRDILHIHVPAFAVAVARCADPSLRNRPVAVAPPSGRGVVLAVSPEARAAGVRKGMFRWLALEVCRSLRLIDPDPVHTDRAQDALLAIARRYTPLWQAFRPGHLYLDLTGGTRLLGPPRDVAARLEREAEALGFAASVGVAGNKLVSRVASQFLEAGGVCDVLRGKEADFLAPLPLDLLPGLGAKRRRVLEDWNLREIGEIPRVPRETLDAVFGTFGRTLRARAAGDDWEPVQAPAAEVEVARSATLQQDEADEGRVAACVRRLAAEGCWNLRATGRIAGRMEVRIRYADGLGARRTVGLVPPTCWDHEVFPQARELVSAAFQRRVRVRWLGVFFSRLAPFAHQLDLFREARRDARREALCHALDEIRHRQGFAAVGYGAGQGLGR